MITADQISTCATKYFSPDETSAENRLKQKQEAKCFTAEMVHENEDMLKCMNLTNNTTRNCIFNGAGGTLSLLFQKRINWYFIAVREGKLLGIFSSSTNCGEIGDEITFTKSTIFFVNN